MDQPPVERYSKRYADWRSSSSYGTSMRHWRSIGIGVGLLVLGQLWLVLTPEGTAFAAWLIS